MNLSFFQFPVSFSSEKLQNDLQLCEKELWTSHFNTRQYKGDWASIALRSGSGLSNDIHSFANAEFKDTQVLKHCSYFREVIDWFKCEKESVRLLSLGARSEIKEHIDNDTSYEDGFFRIHIPIITNSQVFFYVNHQLVSMKMGECWYANFQLPHSVINNSNESRIHLVVDCIRNEWSDEIFAKAGFNLLSTPESSNFSEEVKQKIIAELLLNPTESNLRLIENLKSK